MAYTKTNWLDKAVAFAQRYFMNWDDGNDKNLLPPFSDWTKHANAVVNSDYSLTLNATAASQGTYVTIPVVSGKTYTLSVSAFTDPTQRLYVYKGTQSTGAALFLISNTITTVTLTIDGTFGGLMTIVASSTASGTFTFTNPQLEQAASATSFTPKKLYTIKQSGGTVTQAGTPVNATNLNKLEQGVYDAHVTADAALARSGGAGQSMTGVLYTATTQGALGVASGNSKLEVKNNNTAGDAAYMSFHRQGVYAAHFGIDTDNKWKVGGWSEGAQAYELWHDKRLRVNSGGQYIEWYNTSLGAWLPVGGVTIGASNTVQHSQATEYTSGSSGGNTLVYKFVPKGTGDIKITADIYCLDATYPTYLMVQVGNGEGTGGTLNYSNFEGVLGGTADWTTPIGTSISTGGAGVPMVQIPGLVRGGSTGYGTYSGSIRVHSKEPVYLFMYNTAGSGYGKVKNINVQYDILG